jgi:hypothetical protein
VRTIRSPHPGTCSVPPPDLGGGEPPSPPHAACSALRKPEAHHRQPPPMLSAATVWRQPPSQAHHHLPRCSGHHASTTTVHAMQISEACDRPGILHTTLNPTSTRYGAHASPLRATVHHGHLALAIAARIDGTADAAWKGISHVPIHSAPHRVCGVKRTGRLSPTDLPAQYPAPQRDLCVSTAVAGKATTARTCRQLRAKTADRRRSSRHRLSSTLEDNLRGTTGSLAAHAFPTRAPPIPIWRG